MVSAVVLGIVIGLAIGVTGYTFLYAKGASYLTNDPTACVNCHVMQDQFSGWVKSSHRAVAACNDCHAPHTLVRKYMTKAENGFRHSFAFTTGWFHEPIQISSHNREITEETCRHCHEDMVETIDGPHRRGERVSCTRCHPSVGHGEG